MESAFQDVQQQVSTLLAMSRVRSFLDVHLHRAAPPFLFIGSGFSRRYCNSDDWEGLLRHFASATSRPYEYFRSSADGDLPLVASRIAEEFHEVWWSKPEYAASRDAWSVEATERQSALKIEVALLVRDLADRLPTSGPLRKELELLRRAVIDGIITTNLRPIARASIS